MGPRVRVGECLTCWNLAQLEMIGRELCGSRLRSIVFLRRERRANSGWRGMGHIRVSGRSA